MDEALGSAAREKRDRILLAAREVAQRRGVGAARMEEVAARAGVSKGTLYRFFPSKEDLFLAMMIGSYEEGLSLFGEDDARGLDARGRLGLYFDGLTKVLSAVSERMNVHYQAWGVIAGDSDRKDRLFGFLRAFHADRAQEIERILADGQREGIFDREASVRAVSDTIGALLSGFLYRSTFDPMGASPEALRACFESVVEARLIRGAPQAGDAGVGS